MQATRYQKRQERKVLSEGGTVSWKLEPNFGWLTVYSEPSGLDVTVNGTKAGRTPIERSEREPGVYRVLVTSPCHYNEGKKVKVIRGKEREVSVSLKEKQGAVKVSARDAKGNDIEADVYVDDRKVGRTPGTFKVSVCAKALEVRHRKHGTARKTLRIREHKVTPVELTLELDDLGKNVVYKSGFLFVESEPTGAIVLIDGKQMGKTPYQAELSVGFIHIVECKKGSLYSRKRIHLTQKGYRQSIRLRMELKPR